MEWIERKVFLTFFEHLRHQEHRAVTLKLEEESPAEINLCPPLFVFFGRERLKKRGRGKEQILTVCVRDLK